MTTSLPTPTFLEQQARWQGQMQAVFGSVSSNELLKRLQAAIKDKQISHNDNNVKLSDQQIANLKEIEKYWQNLIKVMQLHKEFLDLYQQNPTESFSKYKEMTDLLENYIFEGVPTIGNIFDPVLGEFKGVMSRSTFIGSYFEDTQKVLAEESLDQEIEDRINEVGEKIKARKQARSLEEPLREFSETEVRFQAQLKVMLERVKPYIDSVVDGSTKLKKKLDSTEKANLNMVYPLFKQLEILQNAHNQFLQSYSKQGFSDDTNKLFRDFAKEREAYASLYSEFISQTTPIPKEVEQAIQGLAGVGLQSLAIKPIQGVALYGLKLTEIMKHMPPSDSRYQAVKAFYEIAKQSAQIVDATTKEVSALVDEKRKYKKADTRVTIQNDLKANNIQSIEAHLKDNLQLPKGFSCEKAEPKSLSISRKIKDKTQKRTTFNIKDAQGVIVFKVNVYPNYISVKQVGGRVLPRDVYLQELKQIHDIAAKLWINKTTPPKLFTVDSETVNQMCTYCYEDNQTPYKLSKKGNKDIQRQWSKEKSTQANELTSNMNFETFRGYVPYAPPVISEEAQRQGVAVTSSIRQGAALQLRQQFEEVIKRGAIPTLNNRAVQDKINQRMKELEVLKLQEVEPKAEVKKKDAINDLNKEIMLLKNLINQGDLGKYLDPAQSRISIDSRDTILAIKQFEGVLAAGFIPQLTTQTAETIKKYVKHEVNGNFNYLLQHSDAGIESQINISGPLGEDGKINGQVVFERIGIAMANGLLVKVSDDAKVALRQYLQSLKQAELAQVMLPMNYGGDAEPVMVLRNLIELGWIPNIDGPAMKLSVKRGEKLPPLKINSGVTALDFDNLRKCYSFFGMRVEVDDQAAMRNYIGRQPPTTLDLTNFSAAYQVEEAKKLAAIGISARINVNVPKESADVTIESSNALHAAKIFQTLLNQGFTPHFSEATLDAFKAMDLDMTSNAAYQVELKGDKPTELFRKLDACFKAGLGVKIDDNQKEILRRYIEKMDRTLPIMRLNGYHGSVVRHNRQLANALNLKVHMSPTAIMANLEEQSKLKANDPEKAQMPVLIIDACKTTKKHVLGNDTVELDLRKTIAQALAAARDGYRVRYAKDVEEAISKLYEMTREVDSKGRPTKNAEKAKQLRSEIESSLKQVILASKKNIDDFTTLPAEALHAKGMAFGASAAVVLDNTSKHEEKRKSLLVSRREPAESAPVIPPKKDQKKGQRPH